MNVAGGMEARNKLNKRCIGKKSISAIYTKETPQKHCCVFEGFFDMLTSVKVFGTGGKRKKIFQDIYFSVEDVDGIGVLYTKTGEYSAILKLENPVQKYSANIDNYYEFTNLLTALAQTLGEGYAIHKQDVFIKKKFHDERVTSSTPQPR